MRDSCVCVARGGAGIPGVVVLSKEQLAGVATKRQAALARRPKAREARVAGAGNQQQAVSGLDSNGVEPRSESSLRIDFDSNRF